MATNRWIGAASLAAQVVTITVTADDAASTYKATIGAATVSVAGTGTGVNATAAAWQAALAASTDPRFLEVAWAVNSAVITGTAVTAGTPFTVSATVTGGTGTIGGPTTTTANSSPSDVNNALNWSNAAVPAGGDNVFIDSTSVSLLWNLGALSAVTVASLTVGASFTGTIGLPEQNEGGTTPYQEYRATYLQIGATSFLVGSGNGPGSGRLKIDNGTVATTLTVVTTGSSIDSNLEAMLWKGTNVGNVVNVAGGSFAAAAFGGETSTIATLNVDGGTVRCGAGTTLTTVNVYNGSLTTNSAVTTYKVFGGNVSHNSGAVTTLTVMQGAVQYQGTGTVATLTVAAASIDFSLDPRGKTVTNCTLLAGFSYNDPLGCVTLSNPITFTDCAPTDGTFALRRNLTLAVTYL